MKMTGDVFKDLIEANPNWCKDLKEKTSITTYADLSNSNITQLSPLLTFTAKKESATFCNCKNLKVATGTFKGYVSFGNSGVEKIEDLKVTGSDTYGSAASFVNCKNLKVAAGTFRGGVYFSDSGIEKIGKLKITSTMVRTLSEFYGCEPETLGVKADFRDCFIKNIPNAYRGEEYMFDETVINSFLRDRVVQQIKSETNLIEL